MAWEKLLQNVLKKVTTQDESLEAWLQTAKNMIHGMINPMNKGGMQQGAGLVVTTPPRTTRQGLPGTPPGKPMATKGLASQLPGSYMLGQGTSGVTRDPYMPSPSMASLGPSTPPPSSTVGTSSPAQHAGGWKPGKFETKNELWECCSQTFCAAGHYGKGLTAAPCGSRCPCDDGKPEEREGDTHRQEESRGAPTGGESKQYPHHRRRPRCRGWCEPPATVVTNTWYARAYKHDGISACCSPSPFLGSLFLSLVVSVFCLFLPCSVFFLLSVSLSLLEAFGTPSW